VPAKTSASRLDCPTEIPKHSISHQHNSSMRRLHSRITREPIFFASENHLHPLEVKRYGPGRIREFEKTSLEELRGAIGTPSSERIFQLYEALKKGHSVDEVYERTKIDKWFIQQMKEFTDFEREMEGSKELSDEMLISAKKNGFSDRYASEIFGVSETGVREGRLSLGMVQSHYPVPVSGADGAYYYSTYNGDDRNEPVEGNKMLIPGGGPNRIGQGIEFDYTCVHTTFALRDAGIKTAMVNCNPETVSTDYDTSDKLYFEPLTVEDVLSIYEMELPDGAIVHFGGQTPLNIAKELQDAGVMILGTSPESIDVAEDRERLKDMMIKLDIPQPENDIARSFEDAIEKGEKIGYPLMVRPSYVLGGRGMEFLDGQGVSSELVLKLHEGRPNIVDAIENGKIQLVFNVPVGRKGEEDDSYRHGSRL